MGSDLQSIDSFLKLVKIAVYLVLLSENKATLGKMQEAILYADYHQKGRSQVISFEECQNIPIVFNDKTSSLDARGECIRLYENRCCQGRSIELVPGSPLIDDLYNAEFDDVLSSVSPCGNFSSAKPSLALQERWLNHTDLLDQVYSDDDVVLYYDSGVNREINWPYKFVGDAWRYIKRSYNLDQIGGLSRNEKLHVIFHSGKASIGYKSAALTYFDITSECKNIIDISSGDNSTWTEIRGDQLDNISEQFGNMVIYLYRGGKNAPTFHYLDKNDSEFVKIITFDMYRGLNMSLHQVRFLQKALTSKSPGSEETEKKFVYWFKDWYYPIYRKFGELNVIRKYLKLSAAYYPTVAATRHFNVTSEASSEPLKMNLGEFIHFWSGVTHQNLQKLAINSFGWTMLNEYQLIQAQKDFPKLSY